MSSFSIVASFLMSNRSPSPCPAGADTSSCRPGLCIAMAATATMAAFQPHHLAALAAALCPS